MLLNYEFPPLGGGAGRATHNVAKGLANSGHQVAVLTSGIKGQKPREYLDGFTIYRVRSWRKGIHDCGYRGALIYVFMAAIKYIQLTKVEKYDVIHYFFSIPTGLISLLPGSHRKIPYIVSLRGSDVPFYDVVNKKLQWFHNLLRPINRKIWLNAEKVVAVTSSLRSTAYRTARDLEIEVIPNGIDSAIFNPQEPIEMTKGKLKLITVTRLIARKGIQHVLQALSELSNEKVNLLIVGTGNYENQLKEMTDALSLHQTVKFYGYCPNEKLPMLLNQHDVFILPSLTEAFGNSFAEAMACGLPVIGSKIGGIPDLVKDENGILVEPGDIVQIKAAINNMIASEAMRIRMGKENSKLIQNRYQWKNVVERYLGIYEQFSR